MTIVMFIIKIKKKRKYKFTIYNSEVYEDYGNPIYVRIYDKKGKEIERYSQGISCENGVPYTFIAKLKKGTYYFEISMLSSGYGSFYSFKFK